MMSLYQAAGHGIPGALESADRGLAWVNERLVERDDWTAVRSAGVLPVGAAALVTAGLVERRLLTGDDQHDDLMRRLGRFLVAQTEPTGAVLASYDVPSEQAEPGVYSRYYTGEAYWALSRLHLALSRRGMGRGRRSGRRLRRRRAGPGRGLLAAAGRPLGRLRPVRDRQLPRTGPAPPSPTSRPSSPSARPDCSGARFGGSASGPGRGGGSYGGRSCRGAGATA